MSVCLLVLGDCPLPCHRGLPTTLSQLTVRLLVLGDCPSPCHGVTVRLLVMGTVCLSGSAWSSALGPSGLWLSPLLCVGRSSPPVPQGWCRDGIRHRPRRYTWPRTKPDPCPVPSSCQAVPAWLLFQGPECAGVLRKLQGAPAETPSPGFREMRACCIHDTGENPSEAQTGAKRQPLEVRCIWLTFNLYILIQFMHI